MPSDRNRRPIEARTLGSSSMTKTVEFASGIAVTRMKDLGARFGPGRAIPVVIHGPGAAPATSGTRDNKLKYWSAQPTHQADQPAPNGAIASTELHFRTSVRRRSKPPSKENRTKENRNEYIRRLVCL